MAEDVGEEIEVLAGKLILKAFLMIPEGATGLVVFAHGSGSSRFSPRNQFVAQTLNDGGLATLLMDLLTKEEETVDMMTHEIRFNLPLLAKRLVDTTDWLKKNPATKDLNIGYFGSSTGAAAALIAAAEQRKVAKAVVSRGGRPDLAAPILSKIFAPTLLIVGGEDLPVIEMNKEALDLLVCEKKLEIIPGATHLFEEPGTLEEVANLARAWFRKHLSY